MADDESVVAEDTSVSDETTSEPDPFEELENSEISFEDGEDDSESEEVEEATEVEESSDETETEAEESPESEVEEEVEEEDTTSDEQPKEKSQEKSQKEIAQEAYKLREERRRLDEERKKLDEQARESWLQQAEDEEELKARQDFLRNEDLVTRESTAYQREIDASITQAVADLKLKEASPEVQEAILQDMQEFDNLYVIKDKQGRITEVKGDVYQYLQKKVGSYQRLMGIGAREQSAKKSNEKARTVPVPTRTPKEPAKDKYVSDFDKEFYGE